MMVPHQVVVVCLDSQADLAVVWEDLQRRIPQELVDLTI